MQGLTDEAVMLKYQEGDMLAMDELLRRYKRPVFSFVYRLLGNLEETQDLMQVEITRLRVKSFVGSRTE